MPTWLTELMNALTKNLGGAKGYLARKLLEYGGRYLLDLYNKWLLEREQKKKQAAVQKDIDEAKPRDEETRKNEVDNLNS